MEYSKSYNDSLIKLIKMIDDKTYFCSYPSDPNIDNINTSYFTISGKLFAQEGNTFVYMVPRDGEILSEITFNNIVVKTVSIEIGGQVAYHADFPEQKFESLKLKPFLFGIPLTALLFHDTVVRVTTLENNADPHVLFTYLFLDTEDRRTLYSSTLSFNHIFVHQNPYSVQIKNGYWFQFNCSFFISRWLTIH